MLQEELALMPHIGAGLMASTTSSTSEEGSHIVLAGLLIQIIIFGFFVAVAGVFHHRLLAIPTTKSHDPPLNWKKFLYISYVTCTFILIRSIIRVAEFVEGFEGNIIVHEVYLYIFDAVPMLAVMVIFNIWYPSNLSKKASKAIIDRETADSVVELQSV